jgi:uncharacterized DUF497 family protein
LFDFSWNDHKARTNLTKHEVSFRLASSVFKDPLSVTIFDEDHSDNEDRWVTLGRAENGIVLVVIHTTEEIGVNELHIRIISARRADRDEVKDYEQVPR